MTWVFGSPTVLGSAVCVADIQVTSGDQTFDCLRKLYGLHVNVVAGFAGNVRTGFEMLDHLQHLIARERSADGPVDVRRIFERFPRTARAVFEGLDDDGRAGGSELLVAGASPVGTAVYGSQSHAARFLGPEFALEEIPREGWGSIGSGDEVPQYRAELEKVTGMEAHPLLQLEAGWRGGYAHAQAIAVMQSVADLPSIRGISKHFHVAVVFADGGEMRTSDRDFFPPDGPPQQIRMPPVAESWDDLVAMLQPHLTGSITTAIA